MPHAVEAFARQVLAQHPALNVLVNNASVYSGEKIASQRDLADAGRMIATNLLGPIRMTDAFIDHLRAQADAAIVNVSSGLAFVPYPAAPTYSATKAALHAYTAAIRPLKKPQQGSDKTGQSPGNSSLESSHAFLQLNLTGKS